VRTSQYDAFGEALLWSLEKQFGAAFTPELKEAWTVLYRTVRKEMERAGMEIRSVKKPATQ
jgi:hemoglobin-like flavoprotein